MLLIQTKRKTQKAKKGARVIPIIILLLIFVIVTATAIGAAFVPFFDTVRIIFKNWGFLKDIEFKEGQEAIIFFIRFPRVVAAALVGSALAISGAVMQGMFKNPMADPGIIGISSGAGFGAVLAITFGFTSLSIYFMPLFASAGAIAAAFIIFILASRRGKIQVLTLILSGIAVSTFINALTNIVLTVFTNDYQAKQYLFWLVGGLSGTMWEQVRLIFIPVILCIMLLLTFSRDLNLMLLGEEEAQAVGLNPSKTRKLLLVLVSVTTASAVCISGAISFVGLIVPHIMRLIIGPDHRMLLPASALGGAVFLVVCDLIARVVVIPNEIGVGIVTSLLGAPYFLYLLIKARKEGVGFS